MKQKTKTAFILTGIIVLLCLASILTLVLYPKLTRDNYTAYIYVNGELYETITLSQVTTAYQLNITTEDGGYNTILVQPGAISIKAADCPDHVCIKQGTITNNLLPITCLPHGLVIELKPVDVLSPPDAPDTITH